MGRLTIELDSETEGRMMASARAEGLSANRWVARLIREKTAEEWPEEIRRLAGAWSDAAEAEELRGGMGQDAARETM